MTAQEDFGEPLGSDLLIEIGGLYARRKLLLLGIRAFLSSVPADVAEDALRTVLIEILNRRGR